MQVRFSNALSQRCCRAGGRFMRANKKSVATPGGRLASFVLPNGSTSVTTPLNGALRSHAVLCSYAVSRSYAVLCSHAVSRSHARSHALAAHLSWRAIVRDKTQILSSDALPTPFPPAQLAHTPFAHTIISPTSWRSRALVENNGADVVGEPALRKAHTSFAVVTVGQQQCSTILTSTTQSSLGSSGA